MLVEYIERIIGKQYSRDHICSEEESIAGISPENAKKASCTLNQDIYKFKQLLEFIWDPHCNWKQSYKSSKLSPLLNICLNLVHLLCYN